MNEREIVNRTAIALLARVRLFMLEYDSMVERDLAPPEQLIRDYQPRIHYTSESTAISILTGDEIWLMDATTSNDLTERAHGIEVMWRVLGRAWELTLEEAQSLPVEDCTEFRSVDLERMGLMLRGALLHASHPVGLAMSFSRPVPASQASLGSGVFDNLPMWREYGSDGTGVGIVFNMSRLLAPMQKLGCDLFDVYYDDEDKDRASRFLVFAALELLRERRSHSSWTRYMSGIGLGNHHTFKQVIRSAKLAASMLSFLFKDKCFSYEQETRLLCCWPKDDVRTHCDARAGRSRSYITSRDLGLTGSLPVSEVCIGPRGRAASTDQLENLCRERSIDIERSSMPYRGADQVLFDFDSLRNRLMHKAEKVAGITEEQRRQYCELSRSRRDSHWDKLNEEARIWNEENRKPD